MTVAHPPLYHEPNIAVLHAMTELVDARLAMVTVHRSGEIHVCGLGQTLDEIVANARTTATVLLKAGYAVTEATQSKGLYYATLAEQAHMPETRLPVGTRVYDIDGDLDDPNDHGLITQYADDGYSVLWSGNFIPQYASTADVAPLPKDL